MELFAKINLKQLIDKKNIIYKKFYFNMIIFNIGKNKYVNKFIK